jgi:hypothetical protein
MTEVTAKMVLTACDTYRKWHNRLAYCDAMRRALEAAMKVAPGAEHRPAESGNAAPAAPIAPGGIPSPSDTREDGE